MAGTRTEMVDGVRITVVEDTREDLQDFLGTAQEIESLEGEEQKEKLEEIFGKEEEEDQDEKKKGEKAEEPEKNQEKETSPRQSSRANTDVVLAMQIADQAAAEAAAETPCYVVHGAKMLCSMGSREARLVVPLDHGALLEGNPQMTVRDREALTNIMCFGNCFSADNPKMEQAAVDATNRYNQEKSQGFWEKFRSFFMGPPETVDSASRELQELCICECEPCFSEEAVWEEGNEKSQLRGEATLIQPDTIVCRYGGVIRIIDNGQNG